MSKVEMNKAEQARQKRRQEYNNAELATKIIQTFNRGNGLDLEDVSNIAMWKMKDSELANKVEYLGCMIGRRKRKKAVVDFFRSVGVDVDSIDQGKQKAKPKPKQFDGVRARSKFVAEEILERASRNSACSSEVADEIAEGNFEKPAEAEGLTDKQYAAATKRAIRMAVAIERDILDGQDGPPVG